MTSVLFKIIPLLGFCTYKKEYISLSISLPSSQRDYRILVPPLEALLFLGSKKCLRALSENSFDVDDRELNLGVLFSLEKMSVPKISEF